LTPLEIAARIANPFDKVELASFDRDDLDRAAKTLVGQKVSLLGLPERYGGAVADTPLSGYVERDRGEYRKQRGEFERIRTAFADGGIPAMLFKSTGVFPSFHYLSSNIDVIVPDGRSVDARRRLVDLGYVELLNVEEPKKCLFRRFPGDGTTFAFHLHEVVGWGVPFVDNEALWRNARPADDDPDIVVPGPMEALLATLAHWFYEDKELSLGNLIGTAYAVRRLDRPLTEGAEAAARFGWEEGYWAALDVTDRAWSRLYDEALLDESHRGEVDRALERHRFVDRNLLARVSYDRDDSTASIPFAKNKLIYYRKILRDPSRPAWRRVKDVVATLLWAVRWKLHVRSQRPVLIAIGGCDGSGKTLQTERLERVFHTCDIRVKVMWSRGASSRFIGAFIRLGKKLTGRRETPAAGEDLGGAGEDVKMEDRRRSLRNPLLRFMFSVLYALDLSWVYCVKTRVWLLTGNVVIADRYVGDALVDYALFSGCPVDRPPLALRLLRLFAPAPRLAAVLDVEPEEALRRKPEEGGTGHLEAGRDAFLKLADTGGYEVFPPEWTPEAINRRLARKSLDEFYDRYGTLLNWLLWSNPGQLNKR
jgi:thymidylate kinase